MDVSLSHALNTFSGTKVPIQIASRQLKLRLFEFD